VAAEWSESAGEVLAQFVVENVRRVELIDQMSRHADMQVLTIFMNQSILIWDFRKECQTCMSRMPEDI